MIKTYVPPDLSSDNYSTFLFTDSYTHDFKQITVDLYLQAPNECMVDNQIYSFIQVKNKNKLIEAEKLEKDFYKEA